MLVWHRCRVAVRMTSVSITQLPVFDAPAGGRLTDEMVSSYRDNGLIVLENFVTVDACNELRQRALELVAAFDPSDVRSVFSTTEK